MKCPHCHEEMDPAWVRCPFDGTILEPKGGNPILFWIIGLGVLGLVAWFFIAQSGIAPPLFGNPPVRHCRQGLHYLPLQKFRQAVQPANPNQQKQSRLNHLPLHQLFRLRSLIMGAILKIFMSTAKKSFHSTPMVIQRFSIPAGGDHITKACYMDDPTNCGESVSVTYDDGSEHALMPGSWCPSSKPSSIDLKVINQDCQKDYLFIDGSYKGAIREVGSAIFSIDYGYHTFEACNEQDYKSCSSPIEWSYSYDGTFTIARGDYCQ